MNHVLDYGEVDLSNNTCEQAVKTLVIDRKNFLFSTSPAGAEANAIWLTLIKSATENGLDELAYLKFLLEKLPKLGAFPKAEVLKAYMPWEQKSANQEVA